MPILDDPKHEKFANLLAKGTKQNAAYKAAGYKPNASHASRLARNGKVEARVAELQAAAAEKTGIDIQQVLEELIKIGFANMRDYIRVTDDGDPFVDLSELSRDQAAAIQSVAVEDFKEGRGKDAREVRKVTFKLHDKRAALVDIGEHLGMFKKTLELGDGMMLVPVINIGRSSS
jgi:phage terminase small subunit